MKTHVDSRIERMVKVWINPRIITTTEIPLTPIDTESLFGLFDRYNSITFTLVGVAARADWPVGAAQDVVPAVPATSMLRCS